MRISYLQWAWRGPKRVGAFVGLIAWLLVMATLDGPGLTIDEPLDVRPGRAYLSALRDHGWGFFGRAVVDRTFRDNAEHPPLGRWLLGVASTIGEPFETVIEGPDPAGHYVLSGRLAPAAAFGLLVGAIAMAAARRWGTASGLASGFALIAMPRVFAHAHLGALDTFLACFWTLALLAGDRALRSARPVRFTTAAGALWALALLTKIHAWLLLPLMGCWAFLRLPWRRALAALAGWTAVGVALFVLGWPWLWYDPIHRLLAYWGTGTARASIRVAYFGQVFNDRDVPWHYPWFYFAVTVPVGLQCLGALGLARAWRERRNDPSPLLLAGPIVLFLALFSTRVPVYDGERLFLLVFPAWAMLIGLGFGRLWGHALSSRRGRLALVALLAGQTIGLITTHPFELSYYNALVGGLPGARALGLELTYWGDAVDNVLLDRLARAARPGASAALAPTLYPGQGILNTGYNRALARRDILLKDDAEALRAEWVVVSLRTAYLRPSLLARLEHEGRLVATRSRQGVVLSELWHVPRSVGPQPPGR